MSNDAQPSGGAGRDAPHLVFDQAAPNGSAKTLSQVLGEIVWLMSRSPLHKTMLIADLEWMVMTPVLLQQFRLYHDSGDAKNAPKPTARSSEPRWSHIRIPAFGKNNARNICLKAGIRFHPNRASRNGGTKQNTSS